MGYQEQLIILLDQCQHVWLQLQSNNSTDSIHTRKDLRDSIKQLVQLQDNYEEIYTGGDITLWEKKAQSLLQQVSQRVGFIVKSNLTSQSTDENTSLLNPIESSQNSSISNKPIVIQQFSASKENERDLDDLCEISPRSSNLPVPLSLETSIFSSSFSQSRFNGRPLPSASSPWSMPLRGDPVGYEARKLSLQDHVSSASPPENDSISISTSTTSTTNDYGPTALVKSNSSLSMYSLPPHVIDAPCQRSRVDLTRPIGRDSIMAEEIHDDSIKTERRPKLSLSLPFKKINSSYSSPVPSALAQINFYKEEGDGNVTRSFASDAIVDHPLRIGVGYGSYICYSCTVFSNKGTPITIRKRYSDFVHIRQQLIKLYPSSMMSLPKLPPKKIVKKFDPIFVEQRRRDLEYFFKYIVLHPTLGSSSIVKQWIAP
ncbi:hypothetical protein BCR42DRAFT_400078 [Absidia repens]|uniref:Sorting nexin MVP1 n=1 Tax=Absidia repens TaxID=90262 RepID=A0A1X2J2F0_9FUNG|nr:hypothetical protein BCR42DRAFT_400078 [Absidia repens]